MGKKTDKKLGRFFFVLAIVSFVITLLEGLFYYNAQAYPNPLFRWMLIIQNSIKAFGFRPEISLKDLAKILNENCGFFEAAVGYAYAFAVFTAPYCTLAVVYKFLNRLLRFKSIRWLFSKKRRIIVFGYNEEVKILLAGKHKDYCIHLVSAEVSNDEELALLRDGIVVHRIDCLKLPDRQLKYFFERMELKKAREIILFDSSSAKNFSLYQMFHKDENKALLLEDVKFFCRCEDDGIKRIIEDYHDSRMKDKDAKGAKDLEIVSIHELRVRKMLAEHPLHEYYLNSGIDPKNWKLHLLIIGFGKLGQQLLLQAMNLGVVSSENEIIVDVVDFDIQNKKSIFANNFNEDYVEIGEDEFVIPPTKADGKLRIRFHKMDIRHKQFYKQLCVNGTSEKDGPYTYIAICVEDIDVSLHCVSEVERYLRNCATDKNAGRVSIGIRMESNRQMAEYLKKNNDTYKNVFVIEETESTICLEDLIHDELTWDAKEYNYIYSSLDITAAGNDISSESKEDVKEKTTLINEKWRNMAMFRRNSNQAVAQHAAVKRILLDKIDHNELDRYFGEHGSILQDKGNVWTFECSEEELTEYQSDMLNYPWVSELSRLEHRRWCYFMATLGWKRTDAPNAKRNESLKENPCLCTWEELRKYKADTCKYDLMPLLMEYKKKKNNRTF
ncbi:MAG: hypothetical protein E7261_05635 [Lachnospiraceae bacterium]|nr:hypothetical protein [Lachnospiraceae bacterium]